MKKVAIHLTECIRTFRNSTQQQFVATARLGLLRIFSENSKRSFIFGINSNKSSQQLQSAARYAKYSELMASGFITLSDGTDWSSRWTGYDLVLETIMNELTNDDSEEKILKEWLKYILPNEKNGDIESGYCFYKNGTENILRIIDTRLMKPNFQKIFWDKVKLLSKKMNNEEGIGFLINQLNNSYENSLSNSYKQPEDMDLKEIFFLSNFEIGI